MKKLKRLISALLMLTTFVSVFTVVGVVNNVNAEFEQTSYQFSSKMGVGINIGNSLDSTSGGETGWGNPKISKALVTAFKNKGFKTVRIPITWGYQCDSAGNINSSYLARVKEVVDYAYSQDMYVIINTHHEMGWLRTWWANAYGEQNTAKLEKMLDRFGTIWTQISKTFASYGERLVFEGYNETRSGESNWTSDSLSRQWLGKIGQRFVDSVRATGGNNAKRYLLLNTYASNAGANDIAKFVKPNDPANHYMLGIHAYYPLDFSFPPSISNGADVTVFDSTVEQSMIASYSATFGYAKEYFMDKGLGVVLGEFGSCNKNNDTERVKHAKSAVSMCIKSGVVPIVWENGDDLGDDTKEPFELIDRATAQWTHESVAAAYVAGASGVTFGSGVSSVTNPVPTANPYASLKTPPTTTAPSAVGSVPILKFDTEEDYQGCWGQAQNLQGGSLNANGILLARNYVKNTENGGLRMSSLGLGCNCLQQQLYSKFSVMAQSIYADALDVMGEESDNRQIRFSVTNNSAYSASFWARFTIPGVTTIRFDEDHGNAVALKPGQTKIVTADLPEGFTFDRLVASDSTIHRAGISCELYARDYDWKVQPIDLLISPIYLVDTTVPEMWIQPQNQNNCLLIQSNEASGSNPKPIALYTDSNIPSDAKKLRFRYKSEKPVTMEQGFHLRTSLNGVYVDETSDYTLPMNYTTEWQTMEVDLSNKGDYKSFAILTYNRYLLYFDDFEFVMADGSTKVITNFNAEERGIYTKITKKMRGITEIIEGGVAAPIVTTTRVITTKETSATTAAPVVTTAQPTTNAGPLRIAATGTASDSRYTVQYKISENPGINSANVTIEFDKSKVQIAAIGNGAIFAKGSEWITSTDADIAAANKSGKFTYTAVRSANNDTTATGDLFGVSFKLASGVISADFVISSSYPTGAFKNAQGKSVEVNAVSDAIGYLQMTTTNATDKTDGNNQTTGGTENTTTPSVTIQTDKVTTTVADNPDVTNNTGNVDNTDNTDKSTTTTKIDSTDNDNTTNTTVGTESPTTNKTTANGDSVMGDVNRDGKINSFDIMLLKRTISQKTGEEDIMDVADMSGDGKLNSFDIMLIKKAILENK